MEKVKLNLQISMKQASGKRSWNIKNLLKD